MLSTLSIIEDVENLAPASGCVHISDVAQTRSEGRPARNELDVGRPEAGVKCQSHQVSCCSFPYVETCVNSKAMISAAMLCVDGAR